MTLAYVIAKDIFDKRPTYEEPSCGKYEREGEVEYRHTLYSYSVECFFRSDDVSEELNVNSLSVSDDEGVVHLNIEEVQENIDKLVL